MIPILIVDDEEPVRKFISRLLEGSEYCCKTAESTKEARVLLSQQEFPLVLCDVSMPEESGLVLVREILENRPGTAVVMVSGLDDPKIARAALEVGAYGYIIKPLKANELTIHVANALHRRRLEVENRAHRDSLERTVIERTADLSGTIERLQQADRELRDAHAETQQLLSTISSILVAMDKDGIINQWNHVAETTFGVTAARASGHTLSDCGVQWGSDAFLNEITVALSKDSPTHLEELRFRRPDGKERILGVSINPFKGENAKRAGYLFYGADITDRKFLEVKLRQAQKLESIGQLAAGIAHEINTPTQYVGDNLQFLKESFQAIDAVLNTYSQLLETESIVPEKLAEVKALTDEVDLTYLTQEIPKAIEQSLEGIERTSKIVRSMKDFAHPGSAEKAPADLNMAIESTIIVARHEWKYVADLITDFDRSLPRVPCLLGDFNQVILNMIVNAAHAISDVVSRDSAARGTITLSTRRIEDWAEIRVSDTGTGIPEAVRPKIFDPFFTTKEVGKGTGQGLAISHAVIAEKHGGSISVETEVGRGTTFIIRLPIAGAPSVGATSRRRT